MMPLYAIIEYWPWIWAILASLPGAAQAAMEGARAVATASKVDWQLVVAVTAIVGSHLRLSGKVDLLKQKLEDHIRKEEAKQ
jgi:hypothetical protein